MTKFLLLLLGILLSACQPVTLADTTLATQPPPRPTSTVSPTLVPKATATAAPTTVPEPSPTPTPAFEICSPLEEETFESLLLIMSKPLEIPHTFGDDTGHHGVDFAYFKRGDRSSIEGIEILAIMAGSSVLILDDHIPYGYTLVIETPLSDLPIHLQETLLDGYQPVPEDPHYRLYCPEVPLPVISGELSIYHLYAHMEIRPSFNRGDLIACGDTLGTVGNTGYSSNPHLHLETRLGPSGMKIETMAHYELTNSPEQMGNYCLWRMSGYYQIFDPFILFDAAQ